jgi:hypothetical protein
MCNGPCPLSNQVCVASDLTDECICVTPVCGDTFPQCGGVCPANHFCRRSAAANECICCRGIILDSMSGVHFASKTLIKWVPYIPPCGYWYNVYRKTSRKLADLDGDGVADDYGACHAANLTDPELNDTDDPPPGFMHTYLVTAEGPGGEGPAGPASNGTPIEGHYTQCP